MIESFVASWPLFHDSYTAGWLIGVLLSLLGVLVVARDQIFIGAAVSQASVLGIAVALRLGDAAVLAACTWCRSDWAHTLMGGLFAVAGALATAGSAGARRESHEAVTGWVFLVSSCFAVLLLAHSPHGMDEVNRLLASSIIGATVVDVVLFAGMVALAVVAVARAHDRLRLLVVDREMASAVGMDVGRWDRALSVALGLAVGLAIHVSGVVYTFGYVVLPALIAKNVCREVRQMFWVSPLAGLAAGVAGFVLANQYDYPPAQAAVALLGGLLAAVWSAGWARDRWLGRASAEAVA